MRMLGTGRPFALVLNNPKMLHPRNSLTKLVSIETVMNEINRKSLPLGVELRDLRLDSSRCEGSIYRDIHNIGEEKRKEYACICESIDRDLEKDEIQKFNDRFINSNENGRLENCLEIMQKTPVRVSHRRTLATRCGSNSVNLN